MVVGQCSPGLQFPICWQTHTGKCDGWTTSGNQNGRSRTGWLSQPVWGIGTSCRAQHQWADGTWQIHTAELLVILYKDIYSLKPTLVTYEQWKAATIEQQKKWVHLKGHQDAFKKCVDAFKITSPKQSKVGGRGLFSTPRDPNAMDTSPGRTHAWLAEVEDFMPGQCRWTIHQQPANQQKQGSNKMGTNLREVICYCCNKLGHMACSCPQKLQWPHQWQPHQGPSCNRQVNIEEQEEVIHA